MADRVDVGTDRCFMSAYTLQHQAAGRNPRWVYLQNRTISLDVAVPSVPPSLPSSVGHLDLEMRVG